MTATLNQSPLVQPPARAYPVAPCQPVAGVPCTIPFPTNLPRQVIPTRLTHAVLINSSPFTLLATHGGVQQQVAPFTTDVLVLQEIGLGQPIIVLPQSTAGTVTVGLDASVYPTWYDGPPPGSYPASIGSGIVLPPTPPQPFPASVPIIDQAVTSSGSVNVAVTVPTWVQALMVRFDDGGASTSRGYLVTVQDTADGTTIVTGYVQGMSQPAFFPVAGRNVTLNMSTLLGGGNSGGLFTGRMIVYGLAGPVTRLTLGATTTTFPFPTGTGFNATATQVATGQQQLVQAPPLGYVIRIRTVWYTYTTAAAAAGQTLFLRGASSGINYGRWIADTATFVSRPTEQWTMYIGANPTLATTEGVNLVNNNAGTVQMDVGYDVVPVPWGASDQ